MEQMARVRTDRMTEHPWHYWTDACRSHRSSEPVASVDISALPGDQKKRLWKWLQANRPELAETLKDSAIGLFRATFDAAVHLPRELVKKALRDG